MTSSWPLILQLSEIIFVSMWAYIDKVHGPALMDYL